MKTRFNTYDLVCSVTELQKYVGLRVNQVYDIDRKTYLIRLQKTDEKIVILLESGTRIHTTDFEWPKNVAPSGFSMKLRKHLKNKRLESLKQLGFDRIVDLQFGTGPAAYHIFLELYDRGNIVLTDCDLVILNILRPHTEGDKVRFAIKEKYPIGRARENCSPPSESELKTLLASAKPDDNLKKILNPNLEFGSAVIEHVLLGVDLQGNNKIGQEFNIETTLPRLMTALKEAEQMMIDATTQVSKGFIIKKVEKRPAENGMLEDFHINQEFHPFLFRQHAKSVWTETDTFLRAVDSFYSSIESQKIDLKAINQEKEALKKLENVRKDHDQRLQQLVKTQELDKVKAELITTNLTLVDQAILAVRTAIANQMDWTDIENLVKQGKAMGDAIASCIKKLKLDINHITLQLSDPYSDCSEEEKEDCRNEKKKSKPNYMDVDVDLDLTAFANATKYYDQKRSAAKKQQKTIESQDKALKSAEKKTKRTLKEMKAIVNISKMRKTLWFEKFFWFISSENYLVIGGRDMTQNELIVKRYMKAGDIYVHAEIHGASSVVIKNPTGEPVPPKTLNEAGVMAICYSVAWEAKVVTAAWWVHSEQVSKTAPTGEYLSAGSFMIRGKKSYLPPGNLIMGFSFLFKLEDSSVFRHKDERKVKGLEEEMKASTVTPEEDVEIVLSEDENEDEDDEEKKLKENREISTIIEEDTKENLTEIPSAFPDTEIKISHTGRQISIENKPTLLNEEENEETVIYLGNQKPVVVKANIQKKKEKSKPGGKGYGKNKKQEGPVESSPKKEEGNAKEDGKLKRGQRGKLKKMKDKYKDQDEEERQLRLEILQNVVTKKTNKREKASIKEAAKKAERNENLNKKKIERPPKTTENENDDSEEEEIQEPIVNTDLDMLSTFTGIPVPEDEILYAIPVVAPYNALQNYKYKVKLTPGTGKRGKAARTAVNMFLKDKTCSPREKDLLKCVKDENLARNLPGKVKVSAPHLHKK